MKKFQSLIYAEAGINIAHKKKSMLQIKLDKLMRNNGFTSYDDYYEVLTGPNNREQKIEFLNVITTNTTHFFREPAHFEFIKSNMDVFLKSVPRITQKGEIRVWCAASSTGEEPVTLAMVLRECLGENIKIMMLATDISTKVLKKAMSGFYTKKECENVSKYYLSKYFIKVHGGYKVTDEILNCISYRCFNLMNTYPSKYGFDIIICRNVMIYFDNDVQEALINRFYENLVPDGLFIIGHSESLINKKHKYKYLSPSIYVK